MLPVAPQAGELSLNSTVTVDVSNAGRMKHVCHWPFRVYLCTCRLVNAWSLMFCLVCTPFVPCGEWDIIGVSNGFIDVFICIPSAQGSKPAKRRRKELVQRSFQVLQHYLSFRNCMQNWRRPSDMRELLDLFWPLWAWQFSYLLAKMLNLEQRLLFCGFVGRNQDQRSPPYKKSVAGVDLVFQCRDAVTFSCQWWILNKACFPPNSK